MDFLKTDLATLHQKLVNQELTVTELVEATLENIEKSDENYDAFITIMREEALAAAKEMDEKGVPADQVLAGIPYGIKDNIVTKDVLTTAASRMLENFKPVYDATVIEKLRDAGAIGVGKLNMDEFAMGSTTETSYFKKTKNAWDTTKVPGGSSGGSAVAVASGQVPYALGTDTGGSVRQPAAFNGIVGMKPSYGRISRWGVIAFGSSFDQVGILSRTVKDNAYVLNQLAGVDEKDQTSSPKAVPDFTANLSEDLTGVKIAVPQEYFGRGVTEEVKATIEAGLETLKSLGATVEEVSLPHTKYGVGAYYILASAEAASNLQRFDGIRYGYRAEDAKNLEELYVKTRSQGFGEEVKRRIMLGTYSLSAGSYDAFFKKAAQIRTLMIQDFQKVFADYDLIVAPTAPNVAYGFGENADDPEITYMNDVLTIPMNMAGLPGMSVNAGFSNGLPIGMQFIGDQFQESKVYQAGYAFEQATKLYEQTPGGAK
ncbi:aspartyl-tRNA(Asn)/glutamyl-tRNA(Gln) amidotransferase subunit A [Weissella uvarum]|uniref:Asp-tRNA(Asn)/Glu-tRNA(Gln) amidotransferase subunit GatA n=1 Tax=Weissella uvarum TaxID=1479233 RepID=UPI0019604F6A|nr:Asp-tRNA(Asn)/Glu-tRNA(Gln) amidotransferase subunit GatA [Weissella uvarum]MBM7617149.1 aspartyl-tRNA(Asn)/glutamyl-tRNA(Gln) amidotransferase subunit A [Weissella uvarum]MCM0595445.1 Asp-tRNA(Asn)/Glu-tRNA(Gln) amidotransferase subunit GatA [Weissella uvarum]